MKIKAGAIVFSVWCLWLTVGLSLGLMFYSWATSVELYDSPISIAINLGGAAITAAFALSFAKASRIGFWLFFCVMGPCAIYLIYIWVTGEHSIFKYPMVVVVNTTLQNLLFLAVFPAILIKSSRRWFLENV